MSDSGVVIDVPSSAEVDDAMFLASLRFRKGADRDLARAGGKGDLAGFCRALRAVLAARRAGSRGAPRSNQQLPQLLQPLWSQHAWDDKATSESLSKLLVSLQKRLGKRSDGVSRKLSTQVQAALIAAPVDASPWTQVTWLIVMAMAADLLDDATLLTLWRQSLQHVAGQVSAVEPTSPPAGEFADDRQLLMTGELPWLAGLVFADLKGAGKLRRLGQRELQVQLEASTDGDGTPHARALHRLPLSLAVFTRSISIGRLMETKLLNRRSADRYEQLVSRAALIAHADGRLALSNGASFAPGSLLRTASILSGLKSSEPATQRLRRLPDDGPASDGRKANRSQSLPKVKRVRRKRSQEAPSTQSDWAELACMRNDLSNGGDSCVIAHHDCVPQLSVTGFERLLIDGAWRLGVDVNGVPVEPTPGWECVCWFSDDDADFVELAQETESGLKLTRQVLLSRTDHWLWLADNVSCSGEIQPEEMSLQVTSELPLGPQVAVADNRWTRELAFQADGLRGTVYPLSLPQDRVQKGDGSLVSAGGRLVLTQTSTRAGLHLPLVIDWSPDRRRKEVRWRQLTVAEDGRRVPAHEACGQRLQIGRHQWLFYHSLQPGQTGRTVLGHHTPHETVVGEFTSAGEVEPLVLVEE